VEGFRHSAANGLEVWAKPLSNNNWAICFLNRSSSSQKINFDWQKENIYDSVSKQQFNASAAYKIFDAWTKKNLGTTSAPLSAEVASHDVLMVKLSK
jgi:alpha-galactosidase